MINTDQTDYTQVKWYVSANHAGGYSYRLCKMPERGIRDLTEECFQVIILILMMMMILIVDDRDDDDDD